MINREISTVVITGRGENNESGITKPSDNSGWIKNNSANGISYNTTINVLYDNSNS